MRRTVHRALLLGTALTISACGGDSTGPDQTPVVAAPASLAIITEPATTLPVNQALQPAPVLELRDAQGKPVAKSGVSISASLVNGTATGTTTATTGTNGRATFPGILVSGALGAHELRFSSTGLTGASLAITLTSGAPAGMTAVSPQLQNAAAGASAPDAPSVRVVDANGNSASGTTVQFTVIGGGGHIAVSTSVADAGGTADAGAWTLGAGLNVLQAVSGTDTVLFRAGGASSPAQSIVAASRTTQTIVTGQELTEQPAVQVLGEGGVPVSGALVRFGGVSGLALLGDSLAVSDAGGIAVAGHWKVLGTGEQQLIGSLPLTSLDSISFHVTAVRSGELAPSGWTENQILKTGTAMAGGPRVAVTSDGKPLPGVAVTFSVTAGGGTPVTATAISSADGIAQGPAWTLSASASLQVMTAGAPGFNPRSVAFHVFAVEALPARIQFAVGDSQSAVILTPLAVDPAVKVTDASGHPIAGYPVQFAPWQGTVSDSTPETDASGIATGGHWTMPRGASPGLTLAVVAEDLEGSPLFFHATSLVGPPAAIYPTTTPLNGSVGGSSDLPTILVLDAGSNRLEGVPVMAEVTVGHGTVTHSGVTNAQGYWGLTSWILDTVAGVNEVTATVAGFPPVTFTSTGHPGPVASMTLDGDHQSAPIFSPVQVSVRLTDRYGNATPHEPVRFVSSGDGRTLPGEGLVGADTNGIARMDWRMGSTAGGYSLTVTHGAESTLSQTFTATATPVTSAFNVDVRYIGTPSTAMKNAVTAAVARWRAIITSDLVDSPLDRPAAECFESQPAITETVDDILIYVETDAIDDVGGILGAAAPCLIRSGNRLPSMGYMRLDAADVAWLAANGELQDVVLHEMGHILGIGSLWEDRGFVVDSGTTNPRYNGPAGIQGYRDFGGLSSTVPLENTGGPGTAESHWREETFDRELMTGYSSGSDNPLTGMTIGALQDLGYTVSFALSEPLALSAGALAQLRARPRRLVERPLSSPIIVVDQGGREVGRERRPH